MDLTLVTSPQEFFRTHVSAALVKQQVKATEEVEFYLVNLLCAYIEPDKLMDNDGNWLILDTPLALMHKAATEAPREAQVKLFKDLGDSSLYLSGYFQDYFNRKTYDIAYFINMGAGAYSQVSSLTKERGNSYHAHLYRELSDRFESFVEVVAQVSDECGPEKPINLLATYDRWMQNQSERLRQKLEKSGISPVHLTSKSRQ